MKLLLLLFARRLLEDLGRRSFARWYAAPWGSRDRWLKVTDVACRAERRARREIVREVLVRYPAPGGVA